MATLLTSTLTKTDMKMAWVRGFVKSCMLPLSRLMCSNAFIYCNGSQVVKRLLGMLAVATAEDASRAFIMAQQILEEMLAKTTPFSNDAFYIRRDEMLMEGDIIKPTNTHAHTHTHTHKQTTHTNTQQDEQPKHVRIPAPCRYIVPCVCVWAGLIASSDMTVSGLA